MSTFGFTYRGEDFEADINYVAGDPGYWRGNPDLWQEPVVDELTINTLTQGGVDISWVLDIDQAREEIETAILEGIQDERNDAD